MNENPRAALDPRSIVVIGASENVDNVRVGPILGDVRAERPMDIDAVILHDAGDGCCALDAVVYEFQAGESDVANT